jgi:hypothetical protein
MSVRWNVAGIALATLLLVPSASRAQGQDPACATAGLAQDGCQKTSDLFQYMAPQLGTLIAGGNAMLGQGSTLGGLGHIRLSLRANFMTAGLPDIKNTPISAGPAVQSTYAVNNQFVALPQLDAAIGLFKGLPLGVTNVGGVDLLVSASYIPTFDGKSVSVEGNHTQVGVGVRIGLIQESIILPGVSLTVLRRDLPKVDVKGMVGSDTLFVNDLKVKTTAWRLVASKSLLLLNLAAGLGRDTYTSDATLSAYVSGAGVSAGPYDGHQKLTRTNYFVDATLNIPFFKIIGEIGQVSGGTVDTYNTFEKRADDSRLYGSVGFRVGF